MLNQRPFSIAIESLSSSVNICDESGSIPTIIEIKDSRELKGRHLHEMTVTEQNQKLSRFFASFIVIVFALLIASLSNLVIFKSRAFHLELVRSAMDSNETVRDLIDEIRRERQGLLCRMSSVRLFGNAYKVRVNRISFVLFFVSLLTTSIVCFRNSRIRSISAAIPTVFNPFDKQNRVESACIYGILAHEVLHSFERIVLHPYDGHLQGPLFDLLRQAGAVLLVGARYFPILIAIEVRPHNFVCYAISAVLVWTEIYFQTAMDGFCSPPNENQIQLFNLSTNPTTNVIFQSKSKILMRLARNAPYYTYSCLLASRLSVLFILDVIRRFWRKSNVMSYFVDDDNLHRNEHNYVQKLFASGKSPTYFRFSKQMVNLYVISFSLIYYFTFWMFKNSERIVRSVFSLYELLNSTRGAGFDHFKQPLNSSVENRHQKQIVRELEVAASLCALICVVQLILGMRKYSRNLMNAYRANFDGIPRRERFANGRLVLKSLHFPGFMVGYLIWGYLILLSTSFSVYLGLRNLFQVISLLHLLLRWILPTLTLYTLKLVLIRLWIVSLTTTERLPSIKYPRLLYIFNYFNFFFDCFIGMIVCLSRVAQTGIAALVFLPRIDHSMFGRRLEHYDKGYASYVCWIHLEAAQTNPIMIVFCDEVKRRIVARRLKRSDLLSCRQISFLRSSVIDRNLFVARNLYEFQRKQRIRFRFALLVTLVRNPWLMKLRKTRPMRELSLYRPDTSLYRPDNSLYRPDNNHDCTHYEEIGDGRMS